MSLKRIYCRKLADSQQQAFERVSFGSRSSFRRTQGRTYARLEGESWHCLYCGAKVPSVTWPERMSL